MEGGKEGWMDGWMVRGREGDGKGGNDDVLGF